MVALEALGFLFVQIGVIYGMHERKDSDTETADLNVKVPNLLNLIPNFNELLMDFNLNAQRSLPTEGSRLQRQEVRKPPNPYFQQVRESYKAVRQAVQSALNKTLNEPNLFSMDLKRVGTRSKLNMESPLGQLSINAKFQANEEAVNEEEGVSTEVPLREYLDDLVQQDATPGNEAEPRDHEVGQTPDFSRRVFEENPTDPLEMYSDVSDSDYSGRSVPLDDLEEYYGQLDHQNYIDSRSGASFYEDESEMGEGVDLGMNEYDSIHGEQKFAYWDTEANDLLSRPEDSYVAEDVHTDFGPYTRSNYMMDVLTKPMHRTTDRHQNFYQGDAFPNNELNMDNYRYNIIDREEPDEEEPFHEYIDDIEAAAGQLTEDAKRRLRRAFGNFKRDLDQIDLGDNFDLNKFLDGEPQGAGRRIIDQRDLEIAFLNLDAETNLKMDPSKKVVLAFTLTGIPLKLYIDRSIENPVEYLHKVLSEAGVTVNVPVHSSAKQEPAGAEVLYVGAGNKGKSVTAALTLEVPEVADIRKYTKRFHNTKHASTLAVESDAEALKEALHKTLTSPAEMKFSDALEESFKKDPTKVLEDISTFFTQAPDVIDSEDDDHVTMEAES